MGVSIALVFAIAAGLPLVGGLRTLPGAPPAWLGLTLLAIGFALYLVAGFATQELILFLGLLGLGVPWGLWALLEFAGVVGPVTSGPWAWYLLYAHALTPVILAGAFFLPVWIRGRH